MEAILVDGSCRFSCAVSVFCFVLAAAGLVMFFGLLIFWGICAIIDWIKQ